MTVIDVEMVPLGAALSVDEKRLDRKASTERKHKLAIDDLARGFTSKVRAYGTSWKWEPTKQRFADNGYDVEDAAWAIKQLVDIYQDIGYDISLYWMEDGTFAVVSVTPGKF